MPFEHDYVLSSLKNSLFLVERETNTVDMYAAVSSCPLGLLLEVCYSVETLGAGEGRIATLDLEGQNSLAAIAI